MVLVQFPDRLHIYPDEFLAEDNWAVRVDHVDRSGELKYKAWLTPADARDHAAWIRRTMEDQPDKVRQDWMRQADQLDHIATVVEKIRRALGIE
ncbi:hypothetical protein BBK14_01865 [Parafrankia soli]|uniref:Uncharacterized protein n=1 Tax=Parafrankia soli TaxID=2599596 RepID=A0A1S1RIJ0_9ACTN|nr:hypothetical protein [Parafrankia soli]OHV46618.1 hypothetical protein BBK14_01865 [Parafrankia soli]